MRRVPSGETRDAEDRPIGRWRARRETVMIGT